jgi:hypothetical protein
MRIGRNLIELLYNNSFKKFLNRKMPKKKRICIIPFFEKVTGRLPVLSRRLDPLGNFLFFAHPFPFPNRSRAGCSEYTQNPQNQSNATTESPESKVKL